MMFLKMSGASHRPDQLTADHARRIDAGARSQVTGIVGQGQPVATASLLFGNGNPGIINAFGFALLEGPDHAPASCQAQQANKQKSVHLRVPSTDYSGWLFHPGNLPQLI